MNMVEQTIAHKCPINTFSDFIIKPFTLNAHKHEGAHTIWKHFKISIRSPL